MQDLGVFHSLGALWLRVLNEPEAKETETVYTGNAGESAEVQDAALPDAIIEKHKVQTEYDWMVRNFTVQELHHENSYASRLYAYMGQKNQVEWLIERLKSDPAARSAAITMSR